MIKILYLHLQTIKQRLQLKVHELGTNFPLKIIKLSGNKRLNLLLIARIKSSEEILILDYFSEKLIIPKYLNLFYYQ